VEVERDEVIDARDGEQPPGHLCRPGLAGVFATILSGVAEVGDNDRHPVRARGLRGIGQEDEHHQVVVHRWARWLDKDDVSSAHVVGDPDANLAVRERPDLRASGGLAEFPGDLRGQQRVSIPGTSFNGSSMRGPSTTGIVNRQISVSGRGSPGSPAGGVGRP